jgi:hypothetical protein
MQIMPQSVKDALKGKERSLHTHAGRSIGVPDELLQQYGGKVSFTAATSTGYGLGLTNGVLKFKTVHWDDDKVEPISCVDLERRDEEWYQRYGGRPLYYC